MCAVGADLEGLQRQSQIVDRTRGAREVVDVVDLLVDANVLGHVVRPELESGVAQMLNVVQRARLEVVDADDAMAPREQRLTEVGTKEAGAAGYNGSQHERDISAQWVTRRRESFVAPACRSSRSERQEWL